MVQRAGLWRGERAGSVRTHFQVRTQLACGTTRGLLVRVRRAGCEAAISPRWRDTQEVVEAVFHRWPSLSKSTTCHGRRAGERGEQAGAQAQPRAWALSPHGQPVRRAGRGKVLATRHRCEQKMQASQPRAPSEKQRNVKGGGAQCDSTTPLLPCCGSVMGASVHSWLSENPARCPPPRAAN